MPYLTHSHPEDTVAGRSAVCHCYGLKLGTCAEDHRRASCSAEATASHVPHLVGEVSDDWHLCHRMAGNGDWVTGFVVGEGTLIRSADSHETGAVVAVAAQMKAEADHRLRTMVFQEEHRLPPLLREQMPSMDCC